MKSLTGVWFAAVCWAFVSRALAGTAVTVEHDPCGSAFAFSRVPMPSNNDAATRAQFRLVDGVADRNGGSLGALCDGQALFP